MGYFVDLLQHVEVVFVMQFIPELMLERIFIIFAILVIALRTGLTVFLKLLLSDDVYQVDLLFSHLDNWGEQREHRGLPSMTEKTA